MTSEGAAPDHKKPNWLLWTTTVLLLPVLYVASFGPACWLVGRTAVMDSKLPTVYAPLGATLQFGPKTASAALDWYASIGLGRNDEAIVPGFLDQADGRRWYYRAAPE